MESKTKWDVGMTKIRIGESKEESIIKKVQLLCPQKNSLEFGF
jgi:hypothetical protein